MLVAAFLNAKSGGEGEGFPKPLLWVYAAALILLPVLAGLANYAVWLRVDQYGLTPERVLATVLAQVVLVKAVWAAATVALGLGDWRAWLPRGTAPLLTLAVLACLAVLSPLADPWALSARSQAGRLISGAADAEAFDYGYLKFQLGHHGKAALERLAATPDIPEGEIVAKRLKYVAETKSYYAWRNELKAIEYRDELKGDLTRTITPWPEGARLPDGLLDHLRRKHASNLLWCVTQSGKQRRCRFVVANMDGDSELEVIFISLGSGGIRLFDLEDGKWVMRSTISGFNYDKAKRALEAGEIRTEPRVVHDLMLGEERIIFRPR